MASSLRYSWDFKEIICVYNNKVKNNFITPYEWGQLANGLKRFIMRDHILCGRNENGATHLNSL